MLEKAELGGSFDRAASRRERDTKWEIFTKTAELFSERGVEAVSIRAIAAEVGIQPGSLYNHYVSKEQLVQEMYTFYLEENRKLEYDTSGAVEELDRLPVMELLLPAARYHTSEDEKLLAQIARIAMFRMHTDAQAMAVIQEVFFDSPRRTLQPILEKMLEKKRIRQIDVDIFLSTFSTLCFSASFLINSQQELGHDRWREILAQQFALLTPEGGNGAG